MFLGSQTQVALLWRITAQLFPALCLLWTLSASAINYSNLNMVAVFTTDGGSSDIVVDLGPASQFYSAAPGSTFSITRYSGASLSNAFSSFDSLKWSAFGSIVGTNGTAQKPKNTIWATRPRSDTRLLSIPWIRQSSLALGGVAGKMDSVGKNARTYGETFGGASNGVSNSGTTLILPTGNDLGPTALMGSGDFGGSWQDTVVNITPADFFSSKSISRSDLFETLPTPPSGPANYLGFFTFKWDGTMTFTAATSAPGVSQAAPSTGPAAGGTAVLLTGSNFVIGASVFFGSTTSATVNVVGSTSITAIAPPGAAGSVSLVVVNPDGQFATLTNGFTYQAGSVQPPAPQILGIAIAGTDVVIRSAGAINGSLRILSSSNVAAPVGDWTPVATNSVGLNGLSTNRLPITPGPGQRFFRLAIP